MEEIVRYFQDERLAVVAAGRMLVIDWRALPTVDMMRALNAAQQEHFFRGQSAPYPAIVLVQVPAGVPKLSAELRREIQQVAGQNDVQLLCLSYAIASTGFIATVARSIISGVNLVMNAKKTHIATSTEAAVDWAIDRATDAGLACDRETILAVAQRMR